MNNLILAKKDHAHFTNLCCSCRNECDDSEMIAIWENRISGLIPKEYLEPDYICKSCMSLTT